MELQRTAKTGIDLTSETEVLHYVYTGSLLIQVIARIALGDTVNPIAGGGVYSLRFYINDALITPSADDNVPVGVTRTMLVSRTLPIKPADVISIRCISNTDDPVVNTLSTLDDVTPLTQAELTGHGPIIVDHNYGGADALSYETTRGVGVADATILIYLKSDYDAGNRSNPFVAARSVTGAGGRWVRPVMLDPGDYVIIYFAKGYGPDQKTVTVA